VVSGLRPGEGVLVSGGGAVARASALLRERLVR
jgi:hypothetical protein